MKMADFRGYLSDVSSKKLVAITQLFILLAVVITTVGTHILHIVISILATNILVLPFCFNIRQLPQLITHQDGSVLPFWPMYRLGHPEK